MAVLGNTSKANLKGVHPNLVKVIEEAIKDTPIDFTVTSGVRTLKEQQALYAQGRTAKGSIVTEKDGVKNKSNHQPKSDGYGHAIDFCPYVNGKLDWNTTKNFNVIANHIKLTAKRLSVSLRWGADWDNDGVTKAQGDKDEKFVDLPHVELK